MIADRLRHIHIRLADACRRCGRDPASVLLIGVTKGVDADRMAEAIRCGLTDVGENRVQEAREKQAILSGTGARWHLIGHLQRNKSKPAVEVFDAVHSVDSLELIGVLERDAAARRKWLSVFVQVNVSGEATKFGCAPEEALRLAQAVAACRQLDLTGLMTIAPLAESPEAARPCFQGLRRLRDAVASSLSRAPGELKLSMGMSHDFEVAVEEGADIVRIGSAIFKGQGA
ncbi:MAG: YggS family pyridoxal phosphate-dependent enzyme [Candidatus Omnitrophica bacterium]|nr:YggS family pyridoxal phosphate-dependent enzyme [Candidatus Omnitrophota bacterium]